MATATLYNIPAKLIPYAVLLAGMPLDIGTTESGIGYKVTARTYTDAHARAIEAAWRDGQLLSNGFITAHVSDEPLNVEGVQLAE